MAILNDKLTGLTPYDPTSAGDRVRLDANESFLPMPTAILARAEEKLRALTFNRCPDPAARELCQAFAARYGVPAENVVAGNGSDELISVLFLGFLEKGDAFATLEPDFSMYGFNGFLNEARQVKIPKKEDYSIDVEETVARCREEQVKLLIFSNPCNPTSVVLPREEVRQLVRGVPDTLVVLDEAYMDFSDQSLLGEFADYDNLLILRTCSKAVGMAALRLGFAVGSKPLIDAVKAVKAPYNVNALSQAFGTAVLESGEELDRNLAEILASREVLIAGLKRLQEEYPGRFELLPCDANFAALVTPEDRGIYEYLWNHGVAVRLTGGVLRITCGAEAENQAVLAALSVYFQEG